MRPVAHLFSLVEPTLDEPGGDAPGGDAPGGGDGPDEPGDPGTGGDGGTGGGAGEDGTGGGSETWTLPAFSPWAGGHPARPADDASTFRRWACGGARVFEVVRET